MPTDKGYPEKGDGGMSKYDPKSAPVKKHGGNKAIHDGVVSSGEKYGMGSMTEAKGHSG